MNETISLLLATAFLAIGGLGLYIYKTSDDDNKKGGNGASVRCTLRVIPNTTYNIAIGSNAGNEIAVSIVKVELGQEVYVVMVLLVLMVQL